MIGPGNCIKVTFLDNFSFNFNFFKWKTELSEKKHIDPFPHKNAHKYEISLELAGDLSCLWSSRRDLESERVKEGGRGKERE